METGVPAKKDCLLFVRIGIQNNMLPEILEVSLYISANNSMSQMEELQGGIFAKHQTRCHCFAAQAALWVSTIFLKIKKTKKKPFLYYRGLQLEEMRENHHNMFISLSFGCLKTKRHDGSTSVRSVSCLKETVA